MQLLMEGSEEGIQPGLGWIRGRVVKFRQDQLPAGLKIPHMGWTDALLSKPSRLFDGMYEDPRFYFVHSYHPLPANREDVLVEADYGYRFVAGVERENISGVQFHPEKSHKFGMKLLENFVSHY
jgi:glutamine amidotransferase